MVQGPDGPSVTDAAAQLGEIAKIREPLEWPTFV